MRSKINSLASFASEDLDSAQEPSSKQIRLDEESDLLSDYKTAIVSPNVSDTRHELEQYLSLPVTDTIMLRFWQEQSNSGKLQKLAMVATQLLATRATSTASERVFLVCGNILNERRCRMQPETLEKLLFLKYNM